MSCKHDANIQPSNEIEIKFLSFLLLNQLSAELHSRNSADCSLNRQVWKLDSNLFPTRCNRAGAGETYYTDGGLLNNMPAQGIEDFCQVIIGVDVIPHKVPTELRKPIDTLAFALRAVQHQNSKEGRDLCRFIIEPQAIEEFHEFSFDAYQAIYQHGYKAATKYIAENPEMMKLAK